jgi:hypothetical protein
MTPQPDDATVVYADDPDDLDLIFAAREGRAAVAGDVLIRDRTTWKRRADGGWQQDPIADATFTKGRR